MDWTSEITRAAERIAGHVQVTPVMRCSGFGLDFPVELKLEQMQHTGSFKARGAFNTLLSQEVPEAGLVAASGGNHGAAVAYAAHRLGHRARIYVPEMAGPAKISLIRNSGADLQVVPGAYANALEQAQTYEAETGAMQVHAYDAPATVAGQGSCFAEWQAQGLEADTLLIAVGGGGLIAGAQARIDRSMDVAIAKEAEALQKGLPVLATVGSTAPFVGLFGTVWGIMHAFIGIAAQQNTSLAVVAPGIAEALLATGLGLLAAIPAVIFYNKLSADSDRIVAGYEAFADEFATILSRQLDA